MTKHDKAQYTLVAIGMLIFSFAMGRAFSPNDTPTEITQIKSVPSSAPSPGLALPSGGCDDDDEEEDDD